MGIQNFSEDVLYVTLPQHPHMGPELESINEMAGNSDGHDVVIDFTKVKILTSASVCSLMILRQLQNSLGRQLVLCGIPAQVRNIFAVTGLEGLFVFAEDKFGALESMHKLPYSPA
jgi:anti-anti-sigma factor